MTTPDEVKRLASQLVNAAFNAGRDGPLDQRVRHAGTT